MSGNGYYQPKDLATKCGVKLSTLNGYLRDAEMFPPKHVDAENNFRYYDDLTIRNLHFFKKLRKKPFSFKINEIKGVFSRLGPEGLEKIKDMNNAELFNYFEENKLW